MMPSNLRRVTNVASVTRLNQTTRLEEEADDLATSVLATGLLVDKHAVGGGQHQMTELTGRKDIRSQLLDLVQSDIESRGDHTALVQSADQVHNDLSRAVIVDDLEVADVTVLLHA